MDSSDVSRWFDEYLDAFAACGRGEAETTSLLAYFGVPLLLTTNDAFFALTSGAEVVAAIQGQIDGMRAAGFASTEVLEAEVSVLNARTALVQETLSRRRSDGSEISQLTATYLVTDGTVGRRISVLVVQATGPAARP